jgi:hypothetical protein
MSEEREHTSRHNETEESPPKNTDHRKCPPVAPLAISRLKACRGHPSIRNDIAAYSGHSLVSRITKFPSIFLVYAHENKKLAPAAANAKGALDLIKWLGKVRFNLHSDKTHGYDPLNTTSEDIQKADAEKILSSQLRLLPPEGSFDSFDNIILCGSEVLGEYARSPYWDEYIKLIENAYQAALEASESDGSTRVRIHKTIGDVVKSELKREGFHHVLTELACLRIRANKSENKSESHGIIPILLNGTEECFPKFIQDSDTIRIEPKSGLCHNQHLHRGFFRLLKRLLRQKGEEIEAFETYYEQCVDKLQTEPGLEEEEFLRLADEEYRKVLQKLIGNSDATIRDEKFLITLASTLKVPLENLRNALETYASRQCQSIERVSGQSLSMDRCYINLAVVDQQESKAKGGSNKADEKENSAENKDLQTLSETFRRLPSIEATDANPQLLFPLQDLFKPRKLIDGRTAVPKRILILGRAGVGKTTLSEKILHEYTWGREWRDLFDWVLLVPLRKLKQKHFGSLTDVFGETYFQQEPRGQVFAQTLRERILGPDKDKTLFILDGLDEIQGWEADESMKTILLELLDHPNVIITSRPTGADLKDKDLQLETIGFAREDVWAFLELKEIVASEEEESTAIKQWIESNSFVQEVVNVPIQLDALCYREFDVGIST